MRAVQLLLGHTKTESVATIRKTAVRTCTARIRCADVSICTFRRADDHRERLISIRWSRGLAAMIKRTHRTKSLFTRPFLLRGVDHLLPAGTYEVITEDELIEGLSFPVYRRVSTIMLVPGLSASTIEMVTIDPIDLAAALDRDGAPERDV